MRQLKKTGAVVVLLLVTSCGGQQVGGAGGVPPAPAATPRARLAAAAQLKLAELENNDSVWADRFRQELAQCIEADDFGQSSADSCSFVYGNFKHPTYWDFLRQGCFSK